VPRGRDGGKVECLHFPNLAATTQFRHGARDSDVDVAQRRLQSAGPGGVRRVNRLQRSVGRGLPPVSGLLAECPRGGAVDRYRDFVSRPVAAAHLK